MTYKVVQWATGNVGVQSLRALLADPRFEVVGGYVYDPAKSGKDLGELAGVASLGVVATDSPADIRAVDADCVVYNALGDSGDAAQCLEDICGFLASGKNVVSTAISTHIRRRRQREAMPISPLRLAVAAMARPPARRASTMRAQKFG